MLNNLYSKTNALIVYIIAEIFMILYPNNLYMSGSLFLLGHIILLKPYINNLIDSSIKPYCFWYIFSIFIMFIYNKDTKISFVVAFCIYLFILTFLAYQTRKEPAMFMWSTHLLFISDILLGINVICIHNVYLTIIYGTAFFLGIGILMWNIITEKELLQYEKM